MVRFELTTLCLQSRCNNHYATSAVICLKWDSNPRIRR